MLDCSVYYKDKICGNMKYCRRGLFIDFDVCSEYLSMEVFKAYITDGTGKLSIGVLTPVDGKFKLNKSVSMRVIKNSGIVPTNIRFGFIMSENDDYSDMYFVKKSVHMPAAFIMHNTMSIMRIEEHRRHPAIYQHSPDEPPAGWEMLPNPYDYLSKRTFYNLTDKSSLFIRTDGVQTLVAAPLRVNQPFALLPAFSVCTPLNIDGKYFAVLKIK